MTSIRPLRLCPLVFASVTMLLGSLFSAAALDNVVITEFMASNNNTVADEDGDFPDWLELYNAGTNTVNLNGWYLTDKTSNPGSWWRFPSTNLPINAYMVVFASGKNRRIPGAPLHTDFRLNAGGEYIALVKPDGVTIQSSFTAYPLQVPGVSYGIPAIVTTTMVISNGSPAKFTVPVNDSLGVAWTESDFNDSSWASVNNGVGFEGETPAPGSITLLADSVADFGGVQGINNWYYGYWNKKADADGIYQASEFIPFPRGTGNVLSSTNYFSNNRWDWPAGDPPFTEISNTSMHPSADNGVESLPTHWVIRRYVAETNGPLRLSGILAVNSTNATCGDGVVAHIIVDGVDVWQRAAFGTSESYSIVVNANVGSTIDFAVEAGPANNDACDATYFTALIRSAGANVVIADTIADWSTSGVQGENNWTYGYYNRTVSGAAYNMANFKPFPSGSGPHSTANFWNGSAWQWFDGDPPFDTIGETLTRPSVIETGGTNGNEHWVIRRWVSEVSGPVVVDWHAAKKRIGGTGVTVNVYQNGTQRDTANITGTDFAGILKQTTMTVQAGDLIDFSMAPGADVDDDICTFNATIHGTTTLAGQFVSDVGNLMTNINASAYLRIPFNISDPATINGVTLRLKYDDGFVAYLNGVPVASDNAAISNLWNSAATASRPDPEATQYRTFDLSELRDSLAPGKNVLAIQGLNASVADPDFLLSAQLLVSTASLNMAGSRYFSGPTPGGLNGVGTSNLGPLITKMKHVPVEPEDNEDLVVTAKISPTINPIGTVRLYYRVMYGSESNVVMMDDGQHGDGSAGDGVYGASIPNTIYTPGQMVRYYFTAIDSVNNLTRQPPLGDTNNSSIYFGTVVKDSSLTNPLPVLHWFIPFNLGSQLDSGGVAARCSLYWHGEFYDNVRFTRHGQSSTGFRKKSYNIDFNSDHHFAWADGERRVDDINLLNTYPDKAHMRNMLAYETHRNSGNRSAYHFAVPVRLQSNAVFYGTAHIVENGDDNYLKRIGRDPNGALYKMYDTMSAASAAEKKTRRFEDRADLAELISKSPNRTWVMDNVDISQVIDFLAAMIVTANVDCCHKNYYVYRDTEGDKEWEMLPWDVDLSFGRNWSGSESYWDDRVYPQNGLYVGGNATLVSQLFASGSVTRQMYLRRVRTLMEVMQQTNGTPAGELKYEKRIDELAAVLAPDAAMDLVKWGSWGGGSQNIFDVNSPYYRTLPQSVSELKTNYMPARRRYVFDQRMGGDLPTAQPANANILIGAIDYNPASHNQEEEYIQLKNTNNFAVDMSGWKLSGGITHAFQGGVVLAATSTVYVAANKLAFRSRAASPHGGQALYVEGPYDGRLSARGETVVLTDTTGRVVSTNSYPGTPSGAQQYLRITEIMYHPPRPSTATYDAEDVEYIELRNTGPTNLNLAGVHFSNGIEFTFPAASLAPGAYVLVVRNTAAFVSRYGNSLNIAGQYSGALDNSGETIRLDDAIDEKILEFRYNNSWYPVTDGPGASLVIRDDTADWRTWDLKESWRPSAVDLGSPGQTDSPPATVLPVIVNEVLTRTDVPLVDAIELYNPNPSAVNISGWFLSDDLTSPKKFVVPANTSIPAGGYLAFYETNSFATGPNAFQLSSHGDETYLFSGNGTQLTGYMDGWSYGAAEAGVSFGRYVNSQTNVHFVAQSARTLGSANALPKVGPVVISEINYRPISLDAQENSVDEYVELANISGAPVPLFDPAYPQNTWRLRSGIDFDFPPNFTLQPGQHLIIVSFDPAEQKLLNSFRTRFSIAATVPVIGPFSGQLENSGESIRLSQPDTPETNSVPYILVDQVDYSNQAPWSSGADGIGLTLQRLVETAYGNDPTNWTAVAPSAGSRYVPGGVVPTITRQPSNTNGLLGQIVEFRVEAAGTAPFFYLWRHNDQIDARGNGAVLTISGVQLKDAGRYSVLVYNSAGSVQSTEATLNILLPVSIAVQPQPVTLRGSTNATDFGFTTNNAVFNVVASVQRPTTYQWRLNGQPIAGATTSSYTVPSVGIPQEGFYDVVIMDSLSKATSNPAQLKVLVPPVFLVTPVNQTVASNASFTASTVVRGNPAVYKYEWREISTVRRSTNTTESTNIISYGPITNLALRTWRLLVINEASPSGSVAQFNVLALADSDGDGLPDDWETQYGLNPASAADKNLDSDGDGMSNLKEFLAGTDPTDAHSYLKIEEAITPGSAMLHFGALSNRTYSILYTDGLGRSPWNKLISIPAKGTDRVETFVDPTWTTNRFYQLITPGQ